MNTSGVASSTAARTAVATGSMEESILALDGPIIVTPTKVDAVGDQGAKDELVGKHEHQRSVDDAGGGHGELPDLAADDVHQDAGYELTPCKGVHRAVGGEQVGALSGFERTGLVIYAQNLCTVAGGGDDDIHLADADLLDEHMQLADGGVAVRSDFVVEAVGADGEDNALLVPPPSRSCPSRPRS